MIVKSAQRLDNLPPYEFAAMGNKIAAMQASGIDIIKLHVGSPDLPPPDHVLDSLERSARNPANHGYAGYSGTPGMREAIAVYYDKRFGVKLDPSTEVLPLIGSKEGMVHLCLAYLDAGDLALVPDPAYPSYAMGAILAGASSMTYHLKPEEGFLPDLESIPVDALKRARLLWVSYPNNPTGGVVALEDMARMVDFAREHNLLLCSDNPYADVTFDGYRAPSVLAVDGAKDVAVEFNTLSKTFNMAGWRSGMFVGSAEAVTALLAVKSNVDSGLFKAICDASETALRDTPREWIDARNTVYQERRDKIMEVLPSLGLEAVAPKATLYIWAKVADGDDAAYVTGALEEARVSLAPGSMYGAQGRGYVRLSLVTPVERLSEALERLQKWSANR